MSEDFETGYTDGEEWSAHNWTEVNATTNVYVADDAVKYAGSYSGMFVGQTTNASREIKYSFSSQTGGYISGEMFARASGTMNSSVSQFGGMQSAAQILLIGFDESGTPDYIQTYSNATYTNTSAWSANTWYRVEWQLNLDQSDGIGAVYFWIDGTEYGPFDTFARADPSGITSFYNFGYRPFSGQYIWTDNIIIYDGARCAP